MNRNAEKIRASIQANPEKYFQWQAVLISFPNCNKKLR